MTIGVTIQASDSTSCSGVDEGSATCLQEIKDAFNRQDFFWWGTWYSDK